MKDSELYKTAIKVARELDKLRMRLMQTSRDPAVEPDAQAVGEVCRRFDPDYSYELLQRDAFIGYIVKLSEPESGNFCLIAPEEPPTDVEEPGSKKFTFHLEMNVRHTLEIEAEDVLEAQEQVFDTIDELVIGECDEFSVEFLEDGESFGPGFSLN